MGAVVLAIGGTIARGRHGGERVRLNMARDLLLWLRLTDIYVQRGTPARPPKIGVHMGKPIELKRKRPAVAAVAVMSFDTPIEDEHGFDVLTDGVRVLGTGYSGDAELYARS